MGAWPASWFAATSDVSLAAVLWASDFLGRLPLAVLYTGVWPAWMAVGFAALWGWMFHSPWRIPQRAFIALLIAGCSWVAASPAAVEERPVLHVTFIDVGQGDCILVESPGGHRMLIDAGPSGRSGDAGRRIVAPYLRARGITELDALIITHPDDDHLGGAASLLAMMRIGRVYRSGSWPATAATMEFDSLVRLRSAAGPRLGAGAALALDDAMRAYILWPDSAHADAPASNNTSIVMKLEYGATSILLTGDAEMEVEGDLVRRYAHCCGRMS